MKKNNGLFYIIFVYLLVITFLLLVSLTEQGRLSDKFDSLTKPTIYRVDSADSNVIGKVEKKIKIGDSYTLVINGDYFEVTEEQYEKVFKNDIVFSYLTKGE